MADKNSNKDRKPHQLREDVVRAARQLFLERGFNQTSMSTLGGLLGVSKPTLYEVFPSKDHLLDAVFVATVDDIDMSWLARAAEAPPAFPKFLDDTANGYKRIVASPRSTEAFALLLREGGYSTRLTSAFLKRVSKPANDHTRRVITSAISAGQCVQMDVAIIQKMLEAPLYHAVMDRTLFGDGGMGGRLVDGYIDRSFDALKSLLCVEGRR